MDQDSITKWISLNGTLEESTSHILRVEENISWISFKVYFQKLRSMLFLWDPMGRLRIQHMYFRNEPILITVHESEHQTAPHTVPGILLSGEWVLELYGNTTEYRIEYIAGKGELPAESAHNLDNYVFWALSSEITEPLTLNRYDPHKSITLEKRWYKGDFHAHSTLSDGKMTPKQLLLQAELRGLDFFTATDHNLLPTAWAAESESVLVIPGIEVSSRKKGHLNALGLRKWIDWRHTAADGGMDSEEGMMRIIREARNSGALISINHPCLMHWSWTFRETQLLLIDALEIWNDPTYPKNPAATEKAIEIWDALWNEGYRITGIGGSDVHNFPDDSYENGGPPSLLGDPSTYVFAEELSAYGILHAVKAGHVYVTRGPILEGCVEAYETSFTFGDDLTDILPESTGNGGIPIRLTVSGLSEASIRWIENGRCVKQEPSNWGGHYEYSLTWTRSVYAWIRVEIRSDSGELLAITNPVYCGRKEPSLNTWGDLMTKYSSIWS